jgi:isoleucyl-tRNA synthetase
MSQIELRNLRSQKEARSPIIIEVPSIPPFPFSLASEDIDFRLQAVPGEAAAQGAACVVVLSTELDALLLAEGRARELVHAIQTQRKEKGCQYTDRIVVGLETDDAELRAAWEQFAEYIQRETLAVRLVSGPLEGVEPVELKLAGTLVKLYIQVVMM